MIPGQFQVHICQGKFSREWHETKYIVLKYHYATVSFLDQIFCIYRNALFSGNSIDPSAKPVLFVKKKIAGCFAIGYRKGDKRFMPFMESDQFADIKIGKDIYIAG